MDIANGRYGFRNRRTGQIVREEVRFYKSEEYGDEIDRVPVLDKSHPFHLLEGLGEAFMVRYSQEIYGRPYLPYALPGNLDDYDIVELDVKSNANGSSVLDDGTFFSTEIKAVIFDLVHQVRWQYPAISDQNRLMKELFSADEIKALRHGVSDLALARLSFKDLDVADSDLPGGILVAPDRQFRTDPVGVIATAVKDGETYALLTRNVISERFHKSVPIPSKKPAPWSEARTWTRVTFDMEGGADVERLFGDFMAAAADADLDLDRWPEGWEVFTYSGSEIVFEVEGVPSEEDGLAVLRTIQDALNGIEQAPAP